MITYGFYGLHRFSQAGESLIDLGFEYKGTEEGDECFAHDRYSLTTGDRATVHNHDGGQNVTVTAYPTLHNVLTKSTLFRARFANPWQMEELSAHLWKAPTISDPDAPKEKR